MWAWANAVLDDHLKNIWGTNEILFWQNYLDDLVRGGIMHKYYHSTQNTMLLRGQNQEISLFQSELGATCDTNSGFWKLTRIKKSL